MSVMSGLVSSDVVLPSSDVYWEAAADLLGTLQPRPILVLTSETTGNATKQQQLQKMLDASGLTSNQYHHIDLPQGRSVGWIQFKAALEPKVVFLLGVMPARLGVTALFKLNEPNRFADGIWLPTLSLAKLDQNAELKKALWLNGMRPVFVDKLYGVL